MSAPLGISQPSSFQPLVSTPSEGLQADSNGRALFQQATTAPRLQRINCPSVVVAESLASIPTPLHSALSPTHANPTTAGTVALSFLPSPAISENNTTGHEGHDKQFAAELRPLQQSSRMSSTNISNPAQIRQKEQQQQQQQQSILNLTPIPGTSSSTLQTSTSPRAQIPVAQQNSQLMELNADGTFHRSKCREQLQDIYKVVGWFATDTALARRRMLESACDGIFQDSFFLMLHQFLCIFHIDATQLPPQISNLENIPDSVLALNYILTPTMNTGTAFLNFGATFPLPFMPLIYNHPSYSRTFESVVQFLTNLRPNLKFLEEACEKRRCPPLAEELVEILKLRSHVLQRAIHTMILRKIWWGADSACLQRATNLFHQNQYSMAMKPRNAHAGTVYPLWAPQYLHLYNQAFPDGNVQDLAEPHTSETQIANMHTYEPPQMTRRPQFTGAQPGQGRPPIYGYHGAAAQAQRTQHAMHGQQLSSSQVPINLRPVAPRGSQTTRRPTTQNMSERATASVMNNCQQSHVYVAADQQTPSERMYRYVEDFAFLPRKLPPIEPLMKHDFKFSMSPGDFAALATTNSNSGITERILLNDSLIYHLRCVKDLPPLSGKSTWMPLDTEWPADIYFRVNEHRLQPRQRLHDGKDTPIDVTLYLKEGRNILRIISNRPKDAPLMTHHMAIEQVKLISHSDIISTVIPVSPNETRNAIVKALERQPTDEEDGIRIPSTSLMVIMTDPMLTPSIWNTPVRGVECHHREAFDLETFLNTRKSLERGEPSQANVWKCPICGGDARPRALVKDEWLVNVRKELERIGRLDVKAIEVKADATWTIREAPHHAHGSAAASNEPGRTRVTDAPQLDGALQAAKVGARAGSSAAVTPFRRPPDQSQSDGGELIVLDDDD